MTFKAFLKAVGYQLSRRHTIRKKLTKSYVSLFLVLVIAATSTFSWFSAHVSVSINGGEYTFESAASLRVNNDKSSGNKLHIEACFLDEASSKDGRNVYLPLSGNFTSTTANMIFREANAGDRVTEDEASRTFNTSDLKGNYIYKSFHLKGSSKETKVFIKSYKVEVANPDGTMTPDADQVNGIYQDELAINYAENNQHVLVPTSQTLPPDKCPIRMAFIADSADDPVVIDPSAPVEDYSEQCNAVAYVDQYGVPETETTNAHSFASYYYDKTPLFRIPANTDLEVTLVIWLEGTMNSSNTAKYLGKRISIDLDIESNYAEMDTISFIDATSGYWVDDDDTILVCSYEDPYGEEGRYKTIEMTKSINFNSDHTWTAEIPHAATENISFYRLCPNTSNEPQGRVWNAWHTCEKVMDWFNSGNSGNLTAGDLQKNRQAEDDYGNKYNLLTYTAINGNGYNKVTVGATDWQKKRLSPCIGYWGYSGSAPTQPETQAPTSSGGGGGTISNDYYIGYNPNNTTYINNSSFCGMYAMHSLGDGTYYYPLQHTDTNFFLIINNANQKGSILRANTTVIDNETTWAKIQKDGSVQWCGSYRQGNGTVYIIFNPSGNGTITITNTNPA